MFNDYKIFLDYDGVLLNSEELIVKYQKESNKPWDEFFEQVNWFELYQNANEINESFSLLREIQKQRDKIYILTKVHDLMEAKVKIKLIRNEKIIIPIFIVPPHVKKSEIYLPDSKSLLIDDSQKNIDDWISHGGKGILFDAGARSNGKDKIKSLHFLLK